MAWSEKLPNGYYRGLWRDASGVRHSASINPKTRQRFTQPKQAETFAIGEEAKAREDGPQNDGSGLTWGQWQEKWLELRRVEPSTKQADAGRIEKHIKPKWENVKLRKMTRVGIQAWVNGLADDDALSASTVRRIHYLLSASMKAAAKAGHIQGNPCQLIDLPTPPPAKEHFLTQSEFWAIHEKMNPPYSDAAVLLAYTGMRFGELAGLHWDRVDMNRGTITVAETWDAVDQKVKAYPKSTQARTIPISPEVEAVLKSLAPSSGKCGHPHVKGSTCASSLLLTSKRGLPLDYSTMREQHFLPALEQAGIGHTRLHDLRHSYASWLAQEGVPLQVIKEMLGHGSVKVTERYSHIGAEQYDRVLAALAKRR